MPFSFTPDFPFSLFISYCRHNWPIECGYRIRSSYCNAAGVCLSVCGPIQCTFNDNDSQPCFKFGTNMHTIIGRPNAGTAFGPAIATLQASICLSVSVCPGGVCDFEHRLTVTERKEIETRRFHRLIASPKGLPAIPEWHTIQKMMVMKWGLICIFKLGVGLVQQIWSIRSIFWTIFASNLVQTCRPPIYRY
jgi:NAD-dependent dihydropyrimidine dehydrogenase PreA subunit